jgi:acetate kinase
MPTFAANACILAVNGGSSSVKFALFQAGPSPIWISGGTIDGLGLKNGTFTAKKSRGAKGTSHSLPKPDYASAASLILEWVQKIVGLKSLGRVGHRVVQGGAKHWQPQPITKGLLRDLRRLSPFDPEHMRGELQLIEAFHRQFPGAAQFACFDTAFHHKLPRVASLLPIPRRYAAKGVRRYGFHGLSCSFLMEELKKEAGARAAEGRVILAHLGNGASMTAVKGGHSSDTSMGFTPTSGLVMGTRTGDLDPGLAWYMAREHKLDPRKFNEMINFKSGLLGVSGTSSDMRVLLKSEKKDQRAAEAVALFCYQAKKYIGAFAASLGGVDTLVFSGGIGENAPAVRSRICAGLEFLGVRLDARRNAASASLISRPGSKVAVRVIRTDEELMIARSVCRAAHKGESMPLHIL